MPFCVVSGVGREMDVLNEGRDRRMGRGSFDGKCGASHCYGMVINLLVDLSVDFS